MGDFDDFDDDDTSGCCSACGPPWKKDSDGNVVVSVSPLWFNVILIFYTLLVLGTGVGLGALFVSARFDANTSIVSLTAGERGAIELADERRRATLAMNNGVRPEQVCLSCESVREDLTLLFKYKDDIETPEPVTCTGEVCLKSNTMIYVGDGGGGYSHSETPHVPSEEESDSVWGA